MSDRSWPDGHAGDWLRDAAGELAHLGFVLRDGSVPGSSPGPRLLVAFRAQPTLEHFDPEEATFWAFDGSHGHLQALSRESALKESLPVRRPFSWGRVRISDRIPVFNQFLGFGGTLLVDTAEDGTLVAAFASPAPILRWSGHSQEPDPFADEIGSFFARIKVPIDFQPGAEARIGAASPEALYAAALVHADARLHAARRLAEADPDLARAVARETRRLSVTSPAAWSEGTSLLGALELG